MSATRPVRVIHVDDEPAFADVVESFLERERGSFDVIFESDPEAALERLETENVQCVVSDYDMPQMDGLEFLDAVRDAHEDLPFILYTGNGSEQVAVEAISRGVTDYLQKQGGTEQYGLLANRIQNAVDQYRATLRAESLDRIRRVHRDVTRALIRARSRETIDRRVCEILSQAAPYRFAWIGDHDADERTVAPRAAAGIGDGYLEEISITTDDGPTAAGPTGRAVRTHEIQVMQNIPEDLAYEPWREAALDRGYRSSAAVPLVHTDVLYGVLNVYADRTDAFDERERALLEELSDDVAYALSIAADERTADNSSDETPSAPWNRMVETLPVGVFRVRSDPEWRIVDGNRALCRVFGAETIDELSDRPVTSVLENPDDHGQIRERIDDDGAIRDVELPVRTLDDERIWVSVTATEHREGSGRFISGLVRDVTDRKRHERELLRHAERYRTVLEQTPDMVAIHDADGTILEVNEQQCETLGYDEAELVGKKVWDIDASSDPDRARLFWEGFSESETSLFEGTFVRNDGETIPVEVHLRQMSGDADEFLAITRDVSDRKTWERQLEAKTAQLERQNERLKEFAEILGHDVPNHLNVAAGYLELAELDDDTDHLDRVKTALDRVETLIDDTQTVIQTGNPVEPTDWVRISSIADACWGSCCLEADDETLEVVTDGEIRADEGRLKQLFENVFWNACEHAGSGVTVRVGRHEDGFYVEDDGHGIPAEERDDVLSPGYTTADDHAGLGLTIVREIVEAHGWDIEVTESDEGGVRFEISGVETRP